MSTHERNALSIITEHELAAGLALISSAENAREIAAQVYAIPLEEQVHYDWIDTPLNLVACVSEELATRIRDALGRTPEARARIQNEQETFRATIAPFLGRATGAFVFWDVVFDRRREAEQWEGLE